MSESMVERVARAILAQEGCNPDIDDWYFHGLVDARDIARAAIEAMRRPTEEMAIAGRQTSLYPARTFAAMIDAALTPAKANS